MTTFTSKLTTGVDTVGFVYVLCNCYFLCQTHVAEFSPFGPWVSFFVNAPLDVFVIEIVFMHIRREGCLSGISVFKGVFVGVIPLFERFTC